MMMDDYNSDLTWLARPPSLFYRWFKARMMAWGAARSTLYITLAVTLLSALITWACNAYLATPADFFPLSISFGVAIPLLVAPPSVWFVIQFMFDAEAARRVAERLAATDSLTQTFNRRHFFRVGEPALVRSQAEGEPVSVLLLDVDHFKSVNDRHGHAMGDVVLKQVAQACQGCVRPQDVLARFGGEEFVLLMPGRMHEDALAAAERLRGMVEALVVQVQNGEVVCPTVSVGVATVRVRGPSMDELIAAADAAMYRAKQEGRNRVAAFLPWPLIEEPVPAGLSAAAAAACG